MPNKRSAALKISGAMLIVLLIVSCEKKQDDSKVPDAEAIQKVAQAVLAAPDEDEAARQRQSVHTDWQEVVNALQVFQRELMAVSLDKVYAGGAGQSSGAQSVEEQNRKAVQRREQALDQLISSLQTVKEKYQDSAAVAAANRAEWQQQFAGAAVNKVASIIAEVTTWRDRSFAEQLESARSLSNRIEMRPLFATAPASEAPTLTVNTEHR